ncbi:MAG: response regulator [Clostridia bacterium]|nr:response regulator [Clostridia bacterium]
MKRIKVLIADTDKEYYEKLKNEIEENEDIKVISYCNDGKEAIVKINLTEPDIVLMDNILNTWDGIEVLDYLKYKNITNLSIIFLSSIYNEKIRDMIISRGAKCVLGKLYNKNELVNMIREYYKQDKIKNKKIIQENKLMEYIQKIFIELGFKVSHKGYKYLKDVIIIKFNDEEIKAKFAYKEIAKKYKTTPACVERAINHTIKTAFSNNREMFWYNVSYNKDECPKNEEFFNMIYEELIMYFDFFNNKCISDEITIYDGEY